MNKIYVDNKLFMSSTTEYADVANKPMINSVELEGNRTSEELNMYTRTEIDNIIASGRSVLVSETDPPVNPKPNVLYYCKRLNQPMHVILYDSEGTAIDLGDAEGDISSKQDSLPRVVDPATGELKYEIGRNAAGDGWEIVSHTVAGAIKELDTNVQLRQKATDNAIVVKDGAGAVVPNVVGALNTLDTKIINLSTIVGQKITLVADKKNATRQYCFDEAFKAGAPLIWRNLTWDSASDLPSGVGSGTSGMCICCPSGSNSIATANRWGNMIWQSQGSGDIYVCYLNKGVPQPWRKVTIASGEQTPANVGGDFLEIKNGEYTYATRGGTIQMNDQRGSLKFMFGLNIRPCCILNPNNWTITIDDTSAQAKGYTYGLKWTAADSNALCYLFWDNTGGSSRIHYEESGASYFGRHMITFTTRT